MSAHAEPPKLAASMFTDMAGYKRRAMGIEIQRALAKRNHDVSNERRIEIKICIHIGDGVNIASRVEPLAGAGGICVSMDVRREQRHTDRALFRCASGGVGVCAVA